MRISRLALVGGLALVAIVAIGECKSRPKQVENKPSLDKTPSPLIPAPQSPGPTSSPAPPQAATSSATENRSTDFQTVADRVRASVILVSVFDASGKLLRTASGFFVSDDGRFVTDSRVVEGAMNAVAKTNDGHICNVTGVLADSTGLELAVVQAETKNKKVPFLSPNKAAGLEPGARIAVIRSPLARRGPAFFERTISAKKSDESGEWFEVSALIPKEAVGSPVTNESGEIIGVVTSPPGKGAGANVIRAANALDSVVAQVEPDTTPRWRSSPSAESPAEGPAAPRRQSGNARLVYSPKPTYPIEARRLFSSVKGSGRYRILFSAKGDVKKVEVLESTRNEALDSAAVETLRQWKAAPGQEWSATVPITFQP
jgi:TonB family protein